MINWQLSKQVIRWPVSLDRIAGSGVDPSRSIIFVKLSAEKLLVFKWSQALPAISGKTVAFDFAHHGHALVTLYVQFLCSDWSKFDRWVHAENLCSILNLVYFDSWSWQSFVSTCDVFNCPLPPDVQNEIKLPLDIFPPKIERKRSKAYLVIILAVKESFERFSCLSSSSLKKANTGKPA